ncbi:MAG: hypothetical protein A2381_19400 [Bdellovibrionales bacterium RIFOXYB1_FULL_37_110]|nr:MAG: hypothetical protein A2417_10900 [Bdellovibrionales bacterium RIFOXYC1_FULL_37_79]OFZ60648.1 MAG: hypothetical protein A2381_19400 [Bdellovibrionales bacterium RIFOXYB1_FULL_37_110]
MNFSIIFFTVSLMIFYNFVYAKTLTSIDELKGGKYRVSYMTFKDDLSVCPVGYSVKCPPLVLENAGRNLIDALYDFNDFCVNKTTGFKERCNCVEIFEDNTNGGPIFDSKGDFAGFMRPKSPNDKRPSKSPIRTALKNEPKLSDALLMFTDKSGIDYESFINDNPTTDTASNGQVSINCSNFSEWQEKISRKGGSDSSNEAGKMIGR